MQKEQPLFVNATEAMKLLGFGRTKFYKWKNQGIVKPKPGVTGHPVYSVEHLKRVANDY